MSDVTTTIEPTVEPTVESTVEPTVESTVEPTVELTVEPTEIEQQQEADIDADIEQEEANIVEQQDADIEQLEADIEQLEQEEAEAADIEADDVTHKDEEHIDPGEGMLQLDEENMHDDTEEEEQVEPEVDEEAASPELEQAVEAEEELSNMWGSDEAVEEPAQEEQEGGEQQEEEQEQKEEEQTYEEEPEEPEEEPEQGEQEEQEEEDEEDTYVSKPNVRTGGFASSSFHRDTASTGGGGGGDVFSRLYSTHTGTHKHGGRRAVATQHSSRFAHTSVYGGGSARDTMGGANGRGWLRVAEETPGPQHGGADGADPHARTSMAGRAAAAAAAGCADPRHGRMGKSARFAATDAKGCYRSRRDIEDEAARELTCVPAPERGGEAGGTGTIGSDNRAHSWSKTDRFVARAKDGRYLSKRDLADTAARDALSSAEVYSSFKVGGSASSSGAKAAFGGAVDRFRPRTAEGHFLSRRTPAANAGKENDRHDTNTGAYSSFRKATSKSRSSSHFGGSTSRFDAGKKNGGLVTPGPGAFELDVGTKGFFGTSSHCPISLLA